MCLTSVLFKSGSNCLMLIRTLLDTGLFILSSASTLKLTILRTSFCYRNFVRSFYLCKICDFYFTNWNFFSIQNRSAGCYSSGLYLIVISFCTFLKLLSLWPGKTERTFWLGWLSWLDRLTWLACAFGN